MDCDCGGLKTEIMSQRKLMVGWFQMLMAELREVKSELNELCELNAANIGEQRVTAAQPRIPKPSIIDYFSASVIMDSDPNSLLSNDVFSKSSCFPTPLLPAREPEIELAPEPPCKVTNNLVTPKMEPEVAELPVEINSAQLEQRNLTLGEQAALALGSLFGAGSTHNEQFVTVPLDKDETVAHQNSEKMEYQQTATKVKRFKCTKCAYSTPFQSRMKTHAMSHSGEKPLACDLCDYRCLQSAHLTKHKQQRHSYEKRFSCDLCDYRCAVSSDLLRHKRYHTGEKPYKCSHCDYRATEKATVRDHERTHTGEKKFKCTIICSYGTNKTATLRAHHRLHHTEEPFRCDLCDYGSVFLSNLKDHKKRKHKMQETAASVSLFDEEDEAKVKLC